MRTNAEDGTVDVRFFGAHDRAWIALKDIFLYSQESPTGGSAGGSGGKSGGSKKSGGGSSGSLEACLQEVELYIKNAEERFGQFAHAQHRTSYDPKKEEEYIRMMYPKVRPI